MCKILLDVFIFLFYLLRQPNICNCPDQYINEQQQIDVDIFREEQVAECEYDGKAYDGYHCRALFHSNGQQFVVDMAFVRLERVLFQPCAVNKDTNNIEARNNQRREGQCKGIVIVYIRFMGVLELDGQYADYYANSQTTGIAHKYFLALFSIAENIVIEKWDKHAECCDGEHRKSVLL